MFIHHTFVMLECYGSWVMFRSINISIYCISNGCMVFSLSNSNLDIKTEYKDSLVLCLLVTGTDVALTAA